MPRTFASEVSIALGGTALSVAAGVLGAKLAHIVTSPLDRSSLRDFLEGGIKSAVAKTVSAPLENIKLMLQFEDEDEYHIEAVDGAADCVRRIYLRDGWRGFFGGNTANVLRYIPTVLFNHAFKDRIKRAIKKLYRLAPNFPGSRFAMNVLAGGISGACSLSVVYPLDFVRTQLMVCTNDDGSLKYASMRDVVEDLVEAPQDLFKLYAGFWVSVAGIVPFRATYFGVHGFLKTRMPYRNEGGLKGLASKFLVAQGAALAAAYMSYPLDTVRRRLQADARKPKGERRYKGSVDCLVKIYRVEGLGALFKGAGYNALRTVTSALSLVVYGELKKKQK